MERPNTLSSEREIFSKLLQAAHLVHEADLQEATKCAKRLEIPLERALSMLKLVSSERLRPAADAKDMVMKGKLSIEEAGRALQYASQHNISFEDALLASVKAESGSSIRLSTSKMVHPLAEYLLTAKLVNVDQLNEAVQKATDMNLSLGKLLVVNRYITRRVFGELLIAFSLVKEQRITKSEAIGLLRESAQRNISIIQFLFERGDYKNDRGDTLTLPEFLLMADCITVADYQDIQEIKLLQDKTYVDIITQQKLLSTDLLQAAVSLIEMIGVCLKPYQAAEALKQVATKKIPLYQIVNEIKSSATETQTDLKLGDMLVEAGIIDRGAIEKVMSDPARNSTIVRIGKRLLEAGLISEFDLYNCLRCQSLFREGIISANQAIISLSYAHREKLKLEDAFLQRGISAPLRMQWNWR